MITRESSFSKPRFLSFYRSTLRRFRGFAFFYGALGFVFLPLQYILNLLNRGGADALRNLIGPAQVYNVVSVFFFFSLSLVIPLVLTVSLFGFLFDRRSIDVFHALPVARTEMLGAITAAAATLLWVPLACNFAVVALVSVWIPGASIGMIAGELLFWMVTIISIVIITAFACMQVGTSFDAAVFSLVLLGSLSAVYGYVQTLSEQFLYGFTTSPDSARLLCSLSPVSLVIFRQSVGHTAAEQFTGFGALLCWAIADVLLFYLSVRLYQKRRSEIAETVGNLGPLQIYVRGICTLIAGSMFGWMICAVFSNESRPVFLLATAAGSLIAYFVGDAVLARGIRSILRALPAAAVAALAVCAFGAALIYDVTGFEERVPNKNNVQSVTINGYYGRYAGEWHASRITLESPEAIALLTEAHRTQALAGRPIYGEQTPSLSQLLGMENSGYISLEYQLASGAKMYRRYSPLDVQTRAVLTGLETNPEFVGKMHAVFRAEPDTMQEIRLTSISGSQTAAPSLTLEEKALLLGAVRSDLLSLTPQAMTDQKALGYLTFSIPRPMDENEIYPSTMPYPVSFVTSEVLLTEDFTATRAALDSLGIRGWDAPLSESARAYIGIYQLQQTGSLVLQTAHEDIPGLTGQLLAGQSKYLPDGEKRNTAFFELTSGELAQMKNDLVSVYTQNSPYAVVAVSDSGLAENEITGYYLIDYARLPDEIKTRLSDAASAYYYGSMALKAPVAFAAPAPEYR